MLIQWYKPMSIFAGGGKAGMIPERKTEEKMQGGKERTQRPGLKRGGEGKIRQVTWKLFLAFGMQGIARARNLF
jgi:hypothetical protein